MPAAQGENEQVAVRRQKLARLRQEGVAYPNDFKPNAHAGELHRLYGNWDGQRLEEASIKVKLAGRLMAHRVMGKSSFAHLQDASGRIQLFFACNVLGHDRYLESKRLDLGDILGIEGELFRTRTGELTVKVEHWRMLCKCLRPLPEKWHGLADKELRYRRRYLDLMVNSDVRKTFILRSKIISALRRGLEEEGFIEVETPMLHAKPGGARARPFITHLNALDMDLYLRIAPELHLKRLLVGGFERVFELNRNFRNEGIDASHNPEFTMVEFYQAYANHEEAMATTERLIRYVANAIGLTRVRWDGVEIDLDKPFARMRLDEAVYAKRPDLRGHAQNKGLLATVCMQEIPDLKPLITWKAGHYLTALFEHLVEPEIKQPTFVTHYPTDVSPLARKDSKEPAFCERFELIAAGREIANGFSELNDPDDQLARFIEQAKAREAGDLEASPIDEDFVRALEYGMPPAAGVGIGVDRLVMMFTGEHSIRDVLLFPHMRPERGN